MELPPGPIYVFRRLYLILPSATVYLTLKFAKDYFDLAIPQWLYVFAIVFALPVLILIRRWYVEFENRRAAAAAGAELAPHVPESSFNVLKKVLRSADGYPAEVIHEWSKSYGNTLSVSLFTSQRVVTSDPEIIKALLATRFESFEKGPEFQSQMGSLLGSGVFNADGKMWQFHRAMTRPFFTRERISDFDIYERNCDLALGTAKVRTREGFPIEFQDLVSRFTLDSATEFLFGRNVNSLSAGIPYPPSSAHKNPEAFTNHSSNVFTRVFMEGQRRSFIRLAFGKDWALREFWKDNVNPLRKIMDSFTEPLMFDALAKRDADMKTAARGERKVEDEDLTLLSHLVKHTQDPKILKDELINLLVAGRDTTASLLTFSMYMIAQHPDIERRLREEVFDKVGPSNIPMYENMREMKYLRAFLNEVLRLYPPVPANQRQSKHPVVIPPKSPNQKPLYIPANTFCIYVVIELHRRVDLWGPDALKFDPDRFLDERLHKYLTPNPFIFCPFNAGPRICLGQQFAYHEATFFLVRLLQRFSGFRLDQTTNTNPPAEWTTATGTKPYEKIRPTSHLTMSVKDGLWVYMDELKTNEVTS